MNILTDESLLEDEDQAHIFMGEVLAEMPSEPLKLWQEIFIVGIDHNCRTGVVTPFIHRTFVNRIQKSGRIGVVNKKDGKIYTFFEEAHRIYTEEIVGGMIRKAQERLDQILSFRESIPTLEAFRTNVLASQEGVIDAKSEDWTNAILEMEWRVGNESAFDYSEALKNPPVPKFTPGEQVYALILPETWGSYGDVSNTERYESYLYDVISTEITSVEFSAKNELKYWNASEFLWLGESDFFRTPEEALARRDEILDEKGISHFVIPTFRSYTEKWVRALNFAQFSTMVDEVLQKTD